MELQSVRNKERKKNESEEDDDSDYRSNEEGTGNDDESNDEDNPIEEEREREEEEEEEEETELMDTTGSNELCCAGDFCTHKFGQEIIGMSQRCRACNGRLHGFPCSNKNRTSGLE